MESPITLGAVALVLIVGIVAVYIHDRKADKEDDRSKRR